MEFGDVDGDMELWTAVCEQAVQPKWKENLDLG